MADQLTSDELRAWRAEAKMSQPEFAAMLGLSRATIARMEIAQTVVPKWMALARDGWRARQKAPVVEFRQLTDDDVRRIAREEVRKAIS